MELGAIIRSQRYRETTLSVASVALTQLTFCEESDMQMLRQPQSDREASDTPSNDNDIERLAMGHAFLLL